MTYQDRVGGLGIADPYDRVRNQSVKDVSDVNLGAYYNFISDPKSAAKNLVRAQGYNPTLNPYVRQLSARLGQGAQLRNLVNIVRGGKEMDLRELAGATEGDLAGGLYPGNLLGNPEQVTQFMGDLNSVVRQASDPDTSQGITEAQRALAKMFEPNASGQYDVDNLSEFFSGLHDRYSSPLLSRLRRRMYEDQISDYRGTVAPSEPNRGLLDFLTSSMRIG